MHTHMHNIRSHCHAHTCTHAQHSQTCTPKTCIPIPTKHNTHTHTLCTSHAYTCTDQHTCTSACANAHTHDPDSHQQLLGALFHVCIICPNLGTFELLQCGMMGHYANKCPKGHLAFLSNTAAAGYEAHAQSKESQEAPRPMPQKPDTPQPMES